MSKFDVIKFLDEMIGDAEQSAAEFNAPPTAPTLVPLSGGVVAGIAGAASPSGTPVVPIPEGLDLSPAVVAAPPVATAVPTEPMAVLTPARLILIGPPGPNGEPEIHQFMSKKVTVAHPGRKGQRISIQDPVEIE